MIASYSLRFVLVVIAAITLAATQTNASSSVGCRRMTSAEFNSLKHKSIGVEFKQSPSSNMAQTVYSAIRPANKAIFSMFAAHGTTDEGKYTFIADSSNYGSNFKQSKTVIRAQFGDHKFVTMLIPEQATEGINVICETKEDLVKNLKAQHIFLYDVVV